MKREWILVLVVFVVVGILVVSAAWMVYDQRARAAVETVIADLEARGLARTIADFEADRPRQEENAAPLLTEAFQLAESIPVRNADRDVVEARFTRSDSHRSRVRGAMIKMYSPVGDLEA